MPNPFDQFDKNPFDQFDSPSTTQQRPKSYGVSGDLPEPETLFTSIKETASNYPGDLYDLIKSAATGAYKTLRHPIDTLDETMIGLAKNVIAPAIGFVSKQTEGKVFPKESIPIYEEAKKKFLESPYGGFDNYLEYAKKHPARAQADLAMLLTGGGKAMEALKIPVAGAKIARVGGIMEPTTAILKVPGTAASYLMPSRVAQKLYASSAKMSTILDPEIRQRLSQKLLDAEVKLSTKGFKKLADDFETMWRGVDGMIDEYVTKGPNEKKTVLDLLKNIDEWENRASLTGRSHIVKGIKNKFMMDLTETVNIGGKPVKILKELDAKQINRIKRDLYQELHSNYGKDMVPMAAAVKMDIAHIAMETLEEMIPGIIPNNKTASAYKEMMDVIKQGVNRIENRDLLSIGVPVRAGATSVISESLGVSEKMGGFAGLALGVLDLPSVKSKIAIRLNKLKTKGVKVSPTATGIKYLFGKFGSKGGDTSEVTTGLEKPAEVEGEAHVQPEETLDNDPFGLFR